MNVQWETLIDWMTGNVLAGNTLVDWGRALVAALIAYTVLWAVRRFLVGHLGRTAHRTANGIGQAFAEILEGTHRGLVLLFSLLIGANTLDVPDKWAARLSQLMFVVLVIQAALWGTRAIHILLRRYVARHAPAEAEHLSATATLISWGLRTTLWAVVLLAILSNLGVNITAFVASLGVGGVAVALAVQNILGDLFASLSIAVDKPFEVGDFVVVGNVSGTIEHVGLKSTRIRSLGGEQVVMSNTDLLKQTISNYKRLQERRVVFGFGITYGTSPEQAAQVPRVVERIVKGSEKLRFDRAHLKKFGDSSLDYEVVYYVLSPEYNHYMDEQQRINLELMRELASLGVQFAFPTRTVIIEGGGAEPREPAPAEQRTEVANH